MSGLFLGTRVSNLKSVAVTVLELLAFNSHDRPLLTDRQTRTHTHIERTHYLRHSLRSLGGDNIKVSKVSVEHKMSNNKMCNEMATKYVNGTCIPSG